jgi:predicted MFS family arabinose efflux permease
VLILRSTSGGVIYPIIFRNLQPQIGFQWTERVIALIVLVTLLLSLAIMRLRVQPSVKRRLLDSSAWGEWPYVFFVAGLVATGLGLFIPIWYIQSFAMQKSDISAGLASYLITILNAGGVAGRILPNFVSDKVGLLNMITPCSLLAGILAICWTKVSNEASIIVFAVLYGFFSASIVSLAPVGFVSLSPRLGVIGTRMGMGFAVMGCGLLVGPPVGGKILTSYGFVSLQIFTASGLIIGGLCMLFARISKAGTNIRIVI